MGDVLEENKARLAGERLIRPGSGIDFEESFATVASLEAIRILHCSAAILPKDFVDTEHPSLVVIDFKKVLWTKLDYHVNVLIMLHPIDTPMAERPNLDEDKGRKANCPTRFRADLSLPKGNIFMRYVVSMESGLFDLIAFEMMDMQDVMTTRRKFFWFSAQFPWDIGLLLAGHPKKQKSTCHLTTGEAVYIALSGCCAQIYRCVSSSRDMDVSQQKFRCIVTIKGAICSNACNSVQHSRSKHIDIRHTSAKSRFESASPLYSHCLELNKMSPVTLGRNYRMRSKGRTVADSIAERLTRPRRLQIQDRFAVSFRLGILKIGLLRSRSKVIFGDDSLGDTKGYGSVNCNGIIFTRVAYVNSLKHNLISISQLCDANFKICHLSTRKVIHVFLPKPLQGVTGLGNKSTASLNINKTSNNLLLKHNLVSGLPSLTKIENLNEVRVKELRSDNGTEFRNHKLEELCDEKGISQNFSSSCTPEQNGVAERRNKTLIEAARTMLNNAKLPKQFWGEAVNTACYTQNRTIIVKRHEKTAYDVFRGRSPDISYFHVFGCPVHIHNHMDHLGKFDEKANDGFFLGYSLVAKAFRVFNIRRQEMEEKVHVTFSEDDEAISQTSIEGDAINFNENRSFPDDEFIEPRTKDTQCSINIEYFPYVFAYENTTSVVLATLQNSVTSEEPPNWLELDRVNS
ncbi:retrovirus-related pol polyprotein from transposon TNT 1-94 [Tanacetum coccineum]